ncbi:hypothetical protein CASFOL_041016 [Castilleja foliolosa]|uniref:Uncharacterized protein n=1 Tax=Castilleja foliolosa TaxID=1961234 RepID=A0ABD3BEY1_9LAMI
MNTDGIFRRPKYRRQIPTVFYADGSSDGPTYLSFLLFSPAPPRPAPPHPPPFPRYRLYRTQSLQF